MLLYINNPILQKIHSMYLSESQMYKFSKNAFFLTWKCNFNRNINISGGKFVIVDLFHHKTNSNFDFQKWQKVGNTISFKFSRGCKNEAVDPKGCCCYCYILHYGEVEGSLEEEWPQCAKLTQSRKALNAAEKVQKTWPKASIVYVTQPAAKSFAVVRKALSL